MEFKDTYNTIEFASEELLYKEKNSKFFGYAYPIESEDQVKPLIENYNNLICTAKDGPILKDPLVENYFIKIDDDIKKITNVEPSIFKFIFLVTLFTMYI